MTKRSKYEKETILNFNEAEATATIYTYNASLKRRLAEFSRKYPVLCQMKHSTPDGSVTYEIDKSRISIRFLPPYSEERKGSCQSLCERAWLSGSVKGGRSRMISGAFSLKKDGSGHAVLLSFPGRGING